MNAPREKQDIRQLASGKEIGLLLAAGISDSVLKNKHQPCPLCGGKDRFRFDNKDGRGTYFCSHCGKGDWVNLLMNHLSVDFMGALHFVRENLGVVKETKAPTVSKQTDNKARLDAIQKGCVKISTGDPVDKYLKWRGIDILPEMNVSYNPAIDYWDKVNDKWVKLGTYPAMVAGLRNNEVDRVTDNGIDIFQRVTYKITYLTHDGLKADVPCQKKLMPTEREFLGASVKVCRFTDTLAVSEGIENALSFTQITGVPCWSADTAGNLQKFDIPKGVKHLIVVADGDFVGKQAAYALAIRAQNEAARENRDVKVTVYYPMRINGVIELITDNGEKIDVNNMLVQ